MKFKFIKDQDYQLEAVNSIIDIFKGQPIKSSNFQVSFGEEEGLIQNELGIGNNLQLIDDELLSNINEIQKRNNLPRSTNIQGRNFTVEMETGTGKTYVYTRTIYELNKKYGFTKFIIVVPSVAIREGVYKSLQMAEEHFREIYENQPCNYFIYDSSKPGRLRAYATSNAIEIMIINIDAFRKSFSEDRKNDKNVNLIHKPNDKMNGRSPIEFIQETNPIVVIDEPQSVDNTDKSKEAISSLNPLCQIRYSATHRELYNMVYKLDPIDAYERKLVKTIEVASVHSEEDFNKPYIKLLKVDNKNGYKANVELDVLMLNNTIRRMSKLVKIGDGLFDVSGRREIYEGFILEAIDCTPNNESIEFTNGDFIEIDSSIGDIDEDLIKRYQIRTTISKHLDKELKYLPKGIKVLSLFFIDKVANYRSYNEDGNIIKGKYAKMFEEEYKSLIQLPKYNTIFKDDKYMLNMNAEKVHDGYFSVDNKGRIKDTKGDTKADYNTYNLIMKDKEKLLSFGTPLRFIFSHSALKEGWDNPNIFQICTLVDTKDNFTKRQKIGRGLRLPVNQKGERIQDERINILTVMANESYEDFVSGLQKEIQDDAGVRFGIIEKHDFAIITYKNTDNETYELGYESSAEIYDYLMDNSYINRKGKVLDKLKFEIAQNIFELPDKYTVCKDEVIGVIKRSIRKLNVKDASQKETINLNKNIFLGDDFKQLWDRIKYKTTYNVDFDSEKLKERCINGIKTIPLIKNIRIITQTARIEFKKSGLDTVKGTTRAEEQKILKHKLPDIVRILQDETNLKRKTIIDILLKSDRLEDFKNNPQIFINEVKSIFKNNLRKMIEDGIKYEKLGQTQYYSQELFVNEELTGYLNSNAEKSTKGIYEYVLYDSDIEKQFLERLEEDEDVKLYTKLPNWFKIDTPIGSYNPDWAILIDKDGIEKLYFVVETKGSTDEGQRRLYENFKITCGRKHFAALGTGVKYEVAEEFDEIKLNQ